MNLPKNVFYQAIIVALAGAFALAYEIRAETFSVELWLEEALVSFIVVFFLVVVTFVLQNKLAAKRGAKITYGVFGWGMVVSVVASLVSSGKFPLFLPPNANTETAVSRVGHKKPWVGRTDAAVLAGVGPTVALIFGIIFIQNHIVADAAILFAAWSLLPIPFSNGFNYFNYSPLDGAITTVLGLVLYITYFLTGTYPIALLVLVLYLPYQWLYIYVKAKRHSY